MYSTASLSAAFLAPSHRCRQVGAIAVRGRRGCGGSWRFYAGFWVLAIRQFATVAVFELNVVDDKYGQRPLGSQHLILDPKR